METELLEGATAHTAQRLLPSNPSCVSGALGAELVQRSSNQFISAPHSGAQGRHVLLPARLPGNRLFPRAPRSSLACVYGGRKARPGSSFHSARPTLPFVLWVSCVPTDPDFYVEITLNKRTHCQTEAQDHFLHGTCSLHHKVCSLV